MDKLVALKNKLNQYRQKYYRNELLRGAIYAVGMGLALVLTVAVLEYVGRFNSAWRLGILITAGAMLLWLVGRYLVYPLFQLAGLGKTLSDEQAARLLAMHFPYLDDTIIGALQLGKNTIADNELVNEAIKQRVEKLSPVPFTQAVHYKENLRFLPVLLVPVLVFIGLAISEVGKQVLQSTDRVIRYSENFELPAPFDFILVNESLKLKEGESYTVVLNTVGEKIPANAELVVNNKRLRMVKTSTGSFSLEINPKEKRTQFSFEADGYRSKQYELLVIPVPKAKNITLRIEPPVYTGQRSKTINQKSTVEVPEGSRLIWEVETAHDDIAVFKQDSSIQDFSNGRFEQRVRKSFDYNILVKNQYLEEKATASSKVRVIKDEFPKVRASFTQDSSANPLLIYNLKISDDYGISKVEQTIKLGTKVWRKVLTAADKKAGVLRLDTFRISQSQALQVYFTVWDNDGINGAKRAISESYTATLLSKAEKDKAVQKQLSQLSNATAEQRKEREKLNKDLSELEKDLRGQKRLEWKDKKRLEDLLQDLEELQKEEAERKKELKKALKKDEKLDEDKKERLEELTEEEKKLEELKDEIQKLLEKLDKEKLQEKLKELQKENNKQARKEERTEKTLEDLLFQRDLLRKADELNKLSEELKKMSKEEKPEEQKSLSEKQKQLDEIEKGIEQLAKKNKELEKVAQSEEFKKSEEKAKEGLEESKQSESQGEQQKSNKEQEKASEGAQEMSDKLMESMQAMMAKQLELNMKSLRQILENLGIYSHAIEKSGETIKDLDQGDPRYRSMLKEQNRLTEGTLIIRDSLTLLAEKAPQVKETVFAELDKMEQNLSSAKELLQEQATMQAAGKHQFSMMAANELALLLEQSLSQMQQMMAKQKPGEQNCQKPGGSKPKPGAAEKKMSELGEKIEKLKKGNKEGKGKGKGLNGKELVEIMAEQELLRQELEKISEKEGSKGNKGNLKKAIEELDKIEEDIINQRLDDNFMERYQRVETRLLENEQADEERKQKEEREAKRANNLEQIEQRVLAKYLKEKGITKEHLIQDDLKLAEFYRTIVKEKKVD